ncbi:hypothetical protein F0562_001606 [Nyssa sinensis]|uniref:Uncharacterized protein n=1 Tax=Nyssa sinensis TaxID=561372 RepID=A0A5J5C7M1_9ASTE|nr:hypothetical protein F0562_001606 [Nyssa sinensis]
MYHVFYFDFLKKETEHLGFLFESPCFQLVIRAGVVRGFVMMSRPILLVFLLIILIITSQFEWKQLLVNDVDASPSVFQKQQQISKREHPVKEKIILSQEKNIQRLKEHVLSLREQLLQCRSNKA